MSVLNNNTSNLESMLENVQLNENEKIFINRNISNIDNDNIINIGVYAFAYCSSLTSISFPACTSIGSYAFYNCSSLTTVNFPACTSIDRYAFAYCSSLTSVSFPACTSIGSYAFRNCRTLSTVILASTSKCTLAASNAFNSTPYAGYSSYFSGTPYIYVPSSLLTYYKTATNWTYFSIYFSTIESM